MDWLIPLLTQLSELSPLAVIGLLGVVILLLVKGKGEVTAKVDILQDNHIHEVATDIKTIAETLQRLEVEMVKEFSWIRARLNGGPRA